MLFAKKLELTNFRINDKEREFWKKLSFFVDIGQSDSGWNPLFYDESAQDEAYKFIPH